MTINFSHLEVICSNWCVQLITTNLWGTVIFGIFSLFWFRNTIILSIKIGWGKCLQEIVYPGISLLYHFFLYKRVYQYKIILPIFQNSRITTSSVCYNTMVWNQVTFCIQVYNSNSKEGSHPEQLQLLISHLIAHYSKNAFMTQNYAGILGSALSLSPRSFSSTLPYWSIQK